MDDNTRRIYEEAFPNEDERIPWDALLELTEKMGVEITEHAGKDGKPTALAVTYRRNGTTWLWYLAVRKDLRGRGAGTRMLTEIRWKARGTTLATDIEAPEQQDCGNGEQRHRRKRFYERNGLRDTGQRRLYNNTEMALLADSPIKDTEWDEMNGELKRHWWRRNLNVTRKDG